MTKLDISKETPKWIGTGLDNDVVLSSRVRLARNLANTPFPQKLNREEKLKVLKKIDEAVDATELKKELKLIQLDGLSPLEKQTLVERHLISPFAASGENGAVYLSEDQTEAVMVNEEDHIRIQCLSTGLNLEEMLQKANRIDDLLESRIDYAFHERNGYLTTCPTNVGTGMRASVMMHLHGHVAANKINEVISNIAKIGLVVRGVYGEGSEAGGNLFQISNQITLGQSEEEIIQKLSTVTKQLIDQERMLEKAIYRANPLGLEDRTMRSLGILKYAKKLSVEEALKYLSTLWQGINLGILQEIPLETIVRLMILVRPAMMENLRQKLDQSMDIDVLRAGIVRDQLK